MIHFTNRKVLLFLGLFLLFFPGFNISLANILMPGTTKHLFFAGSIVFIFLYGNTGLRFTFNKRILALIAAALFFVYWRSPIQTVDRWYLPYVALVASMFWLHTDDKWWGMFWYVIRIYCVFHLVTGLFLLLFPGIYSQFVLPLLRMTDQQARLLNTVVQQRYMVGLTDHYSKMGMYMSLGVIAFAKPMLSGGGKVKGREWFYLGLFAVGLIMTGKRGPFLFAMIAIVFVYWLVNRPFTVKQYLRTYAIAIGILIAIPLLYLYVPQFRSLMERFASDGGDANQLSSGRIELYWLYALQMFRQKPLLGHGWRTFRVLNQQNYNFEITNDAHNIYLQLAAEIGVVGMAIYLTIFIGSFVMAYKAYKTQKHYPALSRNQLVCLELAMAYQVFFLLYGFSGNPLYDGQCYLPYFMSCIMGYAAWYKVRRMRRLMLATEKVKQ